MGLMRGIRKNVKAIYWVVVIVIVVTFVFWGTRVGVRGGAKYVGMAFGKKVSTEEFRRQWQAARERAIEMEYRTGQMVTPEQVEDLAWRRVVELREAERWGITIPTSEIKERIRQRFSPDGNFDQTLYENYLYRRGLTEEQFASLLRDDLKIGILEALVMSTVAVPPQEVRERYDYENEQRKIKFHLVEVDPLLPVFEASAEGEQYYRAHKDEFRQPKKVAVQYVMVESKSFLEKVTVTEEELRNYYEQHKSSYQGADGKTAGFDEVKARVERDLKNQKADRMAREKAEEIITHSIPLTAPAAGGAPPGGPETDTETSASARGQASKMKEVAQKNGLAFARTGLFPEPRPGVVSEPLAEETEFRKTAFSTSIGEISPIVKVSKGYCILSPIRIVPPHIPPFEEVRKQAAEKQREQQLKNAAKRAGFTPEQVERFVREYSATPPDIDVSYDEALRYYNSRKSEFRKPKKVKAQYLLVEKAPFEKEVKISEKEIKAEYEDNQWKYKDEEGKVKPLDTVREEIEKTLKDRKADEKAKAHADEVFVVARPQRLRELAEENGLKLRETRLFARGETIDDTMGDSPIFASVAFQTNLGEISRTFRTEIGHCVLSPVQVVEESVADFEEVAEEAAEKAKKDKAERLAGQIAGELQRQVREKMADEKGGTFETACKELALKVEESGYFRRDDRTIENVGATMGHTPSLFRDEPGKLAYPRRIPKGYFFYVVSEVKPPSDEEFAKDRDKYYDRLAAEKGQEAFTEWRIALMEEANVRSYLRQSREPAPRETPKPTAPRPAGPAPVRSPGFVGWSQVSPRAEGK